MRETREYPGIYPVGEFHFLRDFFLHFIPLVCLGSLCIIVGLSVQKRLRTERIKIRESTIMEQERLVIQTDIAAHASDAMLFSDIFCSVSSLSPDAAFFTSMSEALLVSLSRVKHVYDQVRYLDTQGYEIVRINLENGIPRLVQKHELQRKASRPYFTRAFQAPPGDVIVSRFDLNIEHGKVEQPIKPMLRFSTPVDNAQGTRIGVVVLNYLGARLIDRIKGIAGSGDGAIYLANKEGYWLIGPSSEEEWGFVPGHVGNGTIKKRFPLLWSHVQKMRQGQFVQGNNLFTFATMTATPPVFQQSSAYPRFVESEYWILVSRVSLDGMGAEYGMVGIPLLVSFFFGGGVVCWFWSFARKKKHRAEALLYRMATTDGLTELWNRRQFVHCVETEIERARRYSRQMSMVLFDIDHFKGINDSYGHDQGDEVLMALALRTREICREHDVVARVGGEEFAILLPETDAKQAGIMAERLRAAVAELRIACPEGEIRFTISLGVTCMSWNDSGQNFQTLFKSADAAMYRAKEGGRNRVVVG